MNVIDILVITYLVGLVVTFPLILRLTRARFKQSMESGKVQPGTEIIALLVSQVVSAAIWPVSVTGWVVELAIQRLKRQQS